MCRKPMGHQYSSHNIQKGFAVSLAEAAPGSCGIRVLQLQRKSALWNPQANSLRLQSESDYLKRISTLAKG